VAEGVKNSFLHITLSLFEFNLPGDTILYGTCKYTHINTIALAEIINNQGKLLTCGYKVLYYNT